MALQTKTIAANGSKGHHEFSLMVSEESINNINNESIIYYEFSIAPIQTGWDWAEWGDLISYKININEREYEGTIPNYNGFSTIILKSWTLPVVHNEDGAKTINISFTVTDSTGQTYTSGNAEINDTMILTTIPRASSVSVSNYDLGQNPNVVIGRKVDSFTSTLSYKIGDRTGTLVEKYNDKNYVWQMSEELINQIKIDNPKNRLVDAIVYCDTYDGDTQIGERTNATFKLTIIDKPVITNVVRTELNSSISSLTDKILRSISKNQFTINATAPTGTTIASYKVVNGTQNSGNVTSNIVNLNDIQTFYESDGILKTKFIITCIDARGNVSEEYPLELDFIDYVNVSINKTDVKITRTTNTSSDALLHMVGNFYNGLIGETQNELTIQYKFREQGASEYSELKTISATYENNTFKIDNLEIENQINYQVNNEFIFYIKDIVNDTDEVAYMFTSSIPVEIHHKKGAYIKELDVDKILVKNSELPKVYNSKNISTKDTYSCNYIEEHLIGEIIYEGKLTGSETLARDFSPYKQLKITYCCYDSKNENTGGASNILFLDLTSAGSNVTDYIAGNAVAYFNGVNGDEPDGMVFFMQVVVDTSKSELRAKFAYNGTLQTNTYYYISKIVGYK